MFLTLMIKKRCQLHKLSTRKVDTARLILMSLQLKWLNSNGEIVRIGNNMRIVKNKLYFKKDPAH